MRLLNVDEPELEFGGAQPHIDIRFGLKDYGPLDLLSTQSPKSIRLGLVGTSEGVEGFSQWITRCRNGIEAKRSKQPYLFPAFPSHDGKTAFNCEFGTDSLLARELGRTQLLKLGQVSTIEERIKQAVDIFVAEIEHLCEKTKPDVIVCSFPEELSPLLDDPRQITSYDFHDLLKARAMHVRVPLQLVLPSLWDPSKARKVKRSGLARALQDEATRAWNIHCALYYKAGGTPWRLKRLSTALNTCFVGISFYRSLDHFNLSTSIAQVFNERGEGVVIRGSVATVSKDDLQPHLGEEDAFQLLKEALRLYKREHQNLPARLVVHKTSSYSEGERTGFEQAVAEAEISTHDLLHLRPSDVRLYRDGVYPPLRGTTLELEGDEFIMYTKGSVPFFQTYPGLYIPRPLDVRVVSSEQTVRFLAHEILALTKLNWNTTQFDGGDPVTIQASRMVGQVLRFCGDDQIIAPRYGFYM
jgi:hypothetical protein